MKKVTILAVLLTVASLGIACTTGVAEAAKKTPVVQNGPVCLEKCRARLKSNGTWSTLPRGTCRAECGM